MLTCLLVRAAWRDGGFAALLRRAVAFLSGREPLSAAMRRIAIFSLCVKPASLRADHLPEFLGCVEASHARIEVEPPHIVAIGLGDVALDAIGRVVPGDV